MQAMSSVDNAIAIARFAAGSTPTPDALMVTVIGQQKMLEEMDVESARQAEVVTLWQEQ